MRTKNRGVNHRGKASLGWEDKAWIDQELDGAYFRDVRLGKRLRKLLVTLFFDPTQSPGRLVMRLPARQFKAGDWSGDGSIIGIEDLNQAQFRFYIAWPGSTSLFQVMRLTRSTVSFNKHLCALGNWVQERSFSSKSRSCAMVDTLLPDARKLLTDQGYQFSYSEYDY